MLHAARCMCNAQGESLPGRSEQLQIYTGTITVFED